MNRPADRVRVRRKDLRRPDEFATLTGQAGAWAREHRQTLLIGGAALFGLLIAAGLFARYRVTQNEAAAREFRQAHETFEAGELPEAATAFALVAEEYPRSPFGRLARLYQGHALARQNEGTTAAEAYEAYLGRDPEPAYLRQEALAGLGHAHEASGDLPQALAAYRRASELDGPYRTETLLGAARLEEAQGDRAAAEAIYRDLLRDASDDTLRQMLLSKLPAEAREDVAEADEP